jgi:small subunit ribosomal protein S3Ae
MAVGKNKGLKGKRGKGKKVVDPFTKKEWYEIRAPSQFSSRNCGKTPVVRAAEWRHARGRWERGRRLRL